MDSEFRMVVGKKHGPGQSRTTCPHVLICISEIRKPTIGSESMKNQKSLKSKNKGVSHEHSQS